MGFVPELFTEYIETISPLRLALGMVNPPQVLNWNADVVGELREDFQDLGDVDIPRLVGTVPRGNRGGGVWVPISAGGTQPTYLYKFVFNLF